MHSRVLVVGGSEEYVGAVYLAGITALRSGAESVIIMAPEKVAWAINALSPDVVTRKLPGAYLNTAHTAAIEEKLTTADILVIGNGAGLNDETCTLMRSLMSWSGPKVVDADALKVLRGSEIRNAILTPNAGEWTLLQEHNEIEKLLHEQHVVIIEKGSPTRIHTRGGTTDVPVNDGLHKAGTGDVLAGLCAGRLAAGNSLEDAAFAATKLGNEVAELLTEKKHGYYFLASDLVTEIERM